MVSNACFRHEFLAIVEEADKSYYNSGQGEDAFSISSNEFMEIVEEADYSFEMERRIVEEEENLKIDRYFEQWYSSFS